MSGFLIFPVDFSENSVKIFNPKIPRDLPSYYFKCHFKQCFSYIVEETGVPRENHLPAVSYWQTVSQSVVSSTPHHDRS